MLQRTLMTVGASLTAVVLLLFMIQRKKPRPVTGKPSEREENAGQANNNEDIGSSKDDVKTSIKNDVSGKNTEAVAAAPNGVLVKTIDCSKEKESLSSEQTSKEALADPLVKPLVVKLCRTPGVEIAYQEISSETSPLSLSMVPEKSTNTLQSTPASEQISTEAKKSCHELPTVQVVATAIELLEESPVVQQEKLVNMQSNEQQSTELDEKVDGCNSSKTSVSEQSRSGEKIIPCQDESTNDELKSAAIEQQNEDADKHEVKVEQKTIADYENSSEKNESGKALVTNAGEEQSSTETPCLSSSHSIVGSSLQQSNGGPIDHSQRVETESNGDSCQRTSSSESEQSIGELSKSSSSESTQGNGHSSEKASSSESEQVNGKSSTDAVKQINGESMKMESGEEYYYDNHKLVLPGKQTTSFRRGDYRKLWPQPNDGLVFVKSSPGQPLVPQYLRDTDYLTNRTIPVHDPASTSFLYKTLSKLVYPPENWVRVISVSENLELRVRHDERDMLLEQLEKKGVCDTHSKHPPPRILSVGTLVAAHLDVPRRGLIWCRAHITAILPVTGPTGRRKGRQPQPQHQPQPLFMVESIDHYPAASAEPVRASDLRPLSAHAMQAPFYDQLFYLLNTMPTDAVEYKSGARDLLLEQLRVGHNFLRVKGPAQCTLVDGSCYWMASLASVQNKDGASAMCLLEEELQKTDHAMAIYSGKKLNNLPFNKCIFRKGEAFWLDDERDSSSLESSCGPPNPQQEYLWLRRTDPRIIQAFRGFKLPYKHVKRQYKRVGFNMSLHEYYTVYRHHSSTILLTADPDKVLKEVLDDPQALVILDFHMQTLIRFYFFDPKMDDPEAHVARDKTPMHILSFPKDDNGFLIFGNSFFSDFTKENLRIPIVPY